MVHVLCFEQFFFSQTLYSFFSGTGTHPQFCEQCKDLDTLKSEKIAAAEQWRQYQLQNINNMFEADRQQAEDECTVCKKTNFSEMKKRKK